MAINPYASPAGQANLGIGGNQYGGSNPYLQQNIDNTLGDITRQYQTTVAPARAGAMARSGSFGNSGQQQMQLEDQRNLGQTMARTSNDMRMADYTQQQNMWLQGQQQDLQNRALAQQGVLANRGMDITQKGQDNSYALGLGQNENQRYGIDTGAATSRYGADRGVEASKYGADASAGASMANSNNSYNLGLRQNDLGFAQLDANINDRNFDNRLAGANFGLTAYNTLQNGNNLGLTAGTQMQNTPLNYQTTFGNAANAAGGLGGSNTQTMPGNALTGAMGGYQLANAYNKSNPSGGGDWANGSGNYAQYQNADYGQYY